jgi:hypothetical protein
MKMNNINSKYSLSKLLHSNIRSCLWNELTKHIWNSYIGIALLDETIILTGTMKTIQNHIARELEDEIKRNK